MMRTPKTDAELQDLQAQLTEAVVNGTQSEIDAAANEYTSAAYLALRGMARGWSRTSALLEPDELEGIMAEEVCNEVRRLTTQPELLTAIEDLGAWLYTAAFRRQHKVAQRSAGVSGTTAEVRRYERLHAIESEITNRLLRTPTNEEIAAAYNKRWADDRGGQRVHERRVTASEARPQRVGPDALDAATVTYQVPASTIGRPEEEGSSRVDCERLLSKAMILLDDRTAEVVFSLGTGAETPAQLAARFDVAESTISRIRTRGVARLEELRPELEEILA